jgi:hypothetical protein
VADHDQRGGEPAVVDARKERPGRVVLVAADAQLQAGLGVVLGEEEAVVAVDPPERGQRHAEPPVGLGVVD